MKLWDSVCNVRKRLDDYPAVGSEGVWTHSEIELYLQDGYDAFCRQTKAIFDFFYPENLPPAGNYTARWELDYFESGMIRVGLLNFSGGYWEADYAEAGAIGPRNSTQPWEAEYVEHVFPASLHPVPEDSIAPDRATFDYDQLEAEFTAWFQEADRDFQTTSGTPSRFAMDKDGMSWMRIVPAGSGGAAVPDTVGTYGLLRDTTFLSANLRDRLAHYWRMEQATNQDAVDMVGSTSLPANSDAVALTYSGPENVTSVTGKFGQGIQTLCTNAGLAGDLINFSVRASGPRSFSAWISFTDAATYTLTPPLVFGFVTYTTAKLVRDGLKLALDNVSTIVASGADLTPGTLYHVVQTFDGVDQHKVYVDGSLYMTATLAESAYITDFMVGPWAGQDSAGTQIIDELRWWQRELSSDDAVEDYEYKSDLPTRFGAWGAIREIQGDFPMGGQWGIPRRRYSDDANTRVEYARLGHALGEYPYELPERFAKYVEFYAAAKALERDGPGQDMKLAAHFMGRFQEGVQRMTKRLSENKRSRVAKIGSTGKGPTRPALARLPWQYGRAIRRGY